MNEEGSVLTNWTFIICIAGALVSYAASITLSIAQKHKVKMVMIFLVVGFLAFGATEWTSFQADRRENELENFKKKSL